MREIDGPRIRQAVRGLVVSSDNHVLLVKFKFPDRSEVWGIPGGGKELDESDHETLIRELSEEVGLHDPEIGVFICNHLRRFQFMTAKYDGQRDHIYLVRVKERFEPKPAMTWEQLNAEYVFDIRWWSMEELMSTPPTNFISEAIPTFVSDIVKNGPPTNGPIFISE